MSYKSPYPVIDIPETNILSYIYPKGSEPSDKPIWIDASNPSHSLSLRQALPWIKRLGGLLDTLQVPKGEAVMLLTPNHIFVPVAYLSIVGAGRVFSGANPIYTVSEVEYQIRNTGTRLILAHPSLVGTAIDAGRRANLGKDRIFQFSDRPCAPLQGVLDWRDVPLKTPDTDSWDPMGASAKKTLATINYSSGTTGLPKGVCVSHYNIVANAEQTIFMRDQEQSYNPTSRPEERWLGFLPLYHAYGEFCNIKYQRRCSDWSRPVVHVCHGSEVAHPCIYHAEIRVRRLPQMLTKVSNHPFADRPTDLGHA